MEAWLHEQGYHYIGPTSFYKLTVAEINRLTRGCVALSQTSKGKAGPRKSDWKKMAKFQNLN